MDEFTGGAARETRRLGDLCAVIGSGPSWAAADESSIPSEGALTVLKITNTRPDGSIDLSELAYVAGLPSRTKVIGPTSLVMIRTNGNRKRIGNVYLPSEEVHGAAVSAFQFILDALDAETRDYLYLVLRSPRIQHLMSESASGSTGLGNLAVRWLKNLEIPWPDALERKSQVEVIRAVDDQIAALRGEAKAADMAAGAVARSMLADHAYVRVGNHLDRIESGRSPQAIDRPPLTDEEGVLKVSAVVAFQFIADESKALTAGTRMPALAAVRAGDVLVTRASGTTHRVGAVCRVPPDVRDGLYLSDKTLRLIPADGLDPDFLVVAMALPAVRRQITVAASGSASMKNISQAKIAGLEVPVPEITMQRKVASTILSIRAVGSACRAEAERLYRVRTALLSGLVDRTIEIEPAR